MREFIKKHWGTNKKCAEELGVTEQTVGTGFGRTLAAS
jgi:predicted transcriptional regulator